jgi:hypothetical protein
MSRARCLRFEALESRELLSRAHIAPHHAIHAAIVTPLVLDGTLAVDVKGRALTMNTDGSSTTSAPVAGQLGALGQVRGVWTETTDPYGGSGGLDTLRLHNAQGAFVVTFNNQNNGRPHRLGHGVVYYQHPQQVHGGIGAYAHAVEHGTIQITTSNARSQVVSLTLSSR